MNAAQTPPRIPIAPKPASAFQFTDADVTDWALFTTETLTPAGHSAERITVDELDSVDGDSVQFDAFNVYLCDGPDWVVVAIERHDDGMYHLMDYTTFAVIASGTCLKDVLPALAKAVGASR